MNMFNVHFPMEIDQVFQKYKIHSQIQATQSVPQQRLFIPLPCLTVNLSLLPKKYKQLLLQVHTSYIPTIVLRNLSILIHVTKQLHFTGN